MKILRLTKPEAPEDLKKMEQAVRLSCHIELRNYLIDPFIFEVVKKTVQQLPYEACDRPKEVVGVIVVAKYLF